MASQLMNTPHGASDFCQTTHVGQACDLTSPHQALSDAQIHILREVNHNTGVLPSLFTTQYAGYIDNLAGSALAQYSIVVARCAKIEHDVLRPAKEWLELWNIAMHYNKFRENGESSQMYRWRLQHLFRERAQMEAAMRQLEDNLRQTEETLRQILRLCNWLSGQSVEVRGESITAFSGQEG
jgi:hypothetical protein